MTRRVDNIYLYTGDLLLVCHKKRILRYRAFFNYVGKILTTYSRVQKSIENWSVWTKMALGEVGVSLP